MSGLTTHILDTSNGVPAEGVKIKLLKVVGSDLLFLSEFVTNKDGRTEQPLLQAGSLQQGVYQLHFDVGSYFGKKEEQSFSFLNRVVIEFGVEDVCQHYHIPLLVAPYGYSTYKGS
jgi:5-hydroxyisourate hydrolase